MLVCGVDFSSAPTKSKPIVMAVGEVSESRLSLVRLETFRTLPDFAQGVLNFGRAAVGLDFPLGMPTGFVSGLGLDPSWDSYTNAILSWSEKEFEAKTKDFRDSQPAGEKHLLREADHRAKSISPMMWYGVPLARMFYRGVGCLKEAGLVKYCAPMNTSLGSNGKLRLFEIYPALVARSLIGTASYKNDTKAKQTAEHTANRQEMIRLMQTDFAASGYCISISLSPDVASKAIDDPKGDVLDAVLACIQAAWAISTRPRLPRGADKNEGWIYDPATFAQIAEG